MITLKKFSKYIYNSNSKISPLFSQVNNRLSSTSVEDVKSKQQELELYSVNADVDLEAEELIEREAEIEKKRNKSRLSQQHYNILHGKPPYEEPKCDAHTSLKYKRRMFGRYSYESGVNPGALWPTNEDIQERYDYERIAYPYSIQEMWDKERQRRDAEEKIIADRQRKLSENLAKLNQWKKELIERTAARAKEMNAAKLKREALIEEVRRHFGFKVDPRDPKFKEVLEMKEKQERKKKKEERKQARQDRLLNKAEGEAEKKEDNKEKE